MFRDRRRMASLIRILPVLAVAALAVTGGVLLGGDIRADDGAPRAEAEGAAAALAAQVEAAAAGAAAMGALLEAGRRPAEVLEAAPRFLPRPALAAPGPALQHPLGPWQGAARHLLPTAPQGRMAAPRLHLAEGRAFLLRGGLAGPGGEWAVAIPLDPGLVAGGGRVRLAVMAPDGQSWPADAQGPALATIPIGGTGLAAVALAGAALADGTMAARRRALLGLSGMLAALLLAWLLLRRPWRPVAPAAARATDTLLDGLPVLAYGGTLFPDGSALLVRVTPALERLTGLPAAALCGQGRWRALLDEEGAAALDAARRRLLEQGEAVAEYAVRRADGTQAWLRDHARIVGLDGAGDARIAGLLTDISQERFLAGRANMASKLATLGKMTASIAHELSQPLGAITFAAEAALVALPPPPEGLAARRRLQRIAEQVERARELTRQLRAFGRADAGAAEAVSAAAAVQGALTVAEPLLSMALVRVEAQVPDDLPPLRARQILLEQVLVNLLVNARDAMLRQPPATRLVRILAAAGQDGLRLSVQDHGPGLPPEALGRLFEPFFTSKPAGEGTGLGLAICQGIVESFGGRIEAANTADGACFTLRLPLWEEQRPAAPAGMAA